MFHGRHSLCGLAKLRGQHKSPSVGQQQLPCDTIFIGRNCTVPKRNVHTPPRLYGHLQTLSQHIALYLYRITADQSADFPMMETPRTLSPRQQTSPKPMGHHGLPSVRVQTAGSSTSLLAQAPGGAEPGSDLGCVMAASGLHTRLRLTFIVMPNADAPDAPQTPLCCNLKHVKAVAVESVLSIQMSVTTFIVHTIQGDPHMSCSTWQS